MNSQIKDSTETPPSAIPSWLWLLAVLCLFVRLWNVGHYPLRSQHDATVHLGYLRELAHLHVPQTYNAPWYYGLLCLAAAPAIVVCKALQLAETTLATAAVGLGNTVFFVLYCVGAQQLARGLRFSLRDSLLVAVLAGSFPAVHRTLDMVRPENLILTLLPWSLWLTLRWRGATANPSKAWALWGAAFAAALAVSQKLGGLSLAAGMGALALVCDTGSPDARLRRLVPALLATGGFVVLLTATHVGLSGGANPMVHDPDPAPTSPPPSGFFLRLDPIGLWSQPIRDTHRGSMPGILLADMYGDYWQYGYDAGPLKPPRKTSIQRGQLGLVLTSLFCLLAVGATVLLAREAAVGKSPLRERALARSSCILPAPLGVLYLAAAALQFYRPTDGDIIKWEYIPWAFPCAAVLLGDLMERSPAARGTTMRLAVVVLICGGLLQSVVW